MSDDVLRDRVRMGRDDITVRDDAGKWWRIDGHPGRIDDSPGKAVHQLLTALTRERDALRDDRDVLGQVGRMYLDALDADPENELLTLGEAYRVTAVREAVDRFEADNAAPPTTS